MPRFGVREICEVVLKAKGAQKIGNKVFYAGEPVCYFDSLKTSSMEGAATTVYANGGRGNARLMSWDGERTVTFTMEDALISPESFMILSGAGLIEADAAKKQYVYQHITETIDKQSGVVVATDGLSFFVKVAKKPYLPADAQDNYAYAMLVKNGEIISEPYIVFHAGTAEAPGVGTKPENEEAATLDAAFGEGIAYLPAGDKDSDGFWIKVIKGKNYGGNATTDYEVIEVDKLFDSVLMDYYVRHESGAKQIEITADKFGGNFYLEASTLWRDTDGNDWPAEFIIPNCRVQSNFTFTMAPTGDPSTFTFTMDAFPDYTKFNKTEKVFSAIQVIEPAGAADLLRNQTYHDPDHDAYF